MATKTRSVALNGSAGALISIAVTQACKRMEVFEDGLAGTPQGLTITSYEDNFATTKTYDPSEEPLIFQNQSPGSTGNRDTLLGLPQQQDASGNVTVAKIILKAKSATANATTVRVTEYDR